MLKINNARVNVMISDMEQSIDFYVNILGLDLTNRYGDHYAELNACDFVIALHPTNEKIQFGTNMSIGLGVQDFDESISKLQELGVEFTFEQGGYIRLAHFKDPDGNQLFLAENQ